MARFTFVLLVVHAMSMGCGEGTVFVPEHATSQEEVIGGELTCERPAIGRLLSGGLCTGTLVAPDVVLTAAHCLDYESRDLGPDDRSVTFEINAFCGDEERFYADRYVSYGSGLSRDDLALVLLRRPVPSTLAVPLEMAASRPHLGEWVTLFGHGCRGRDANGHWAEPGAGPKSSSTHRYWMLSDALCGGDSGGPGLRASGTIYSVNSGVAYLEDGDGRWIIHWDLFADVVGHREILAEQIRAWHAELPDCTLLGTLEDCDEVSGHCAWYACQDTCLPRGTPLEEACGPSAPEPDPDPGFCDRTIDGFWCDGDDLVACRSEEEVERSPCSIGCEANGPGGQGMCTPPPAQACGDFTSLGACDEHTDRCAWYACTGLCLPRGTDVDTTCGCAGIARVDDCAGECAWYHCQERCLARGTDVDEVCGTP